MKQKEQRPKALLKYTGPRRTTHTQQHMENGCTYTMCVLDNLVCPFIICKASSPRAPAMTHSSSSKNLEMKHLQDLPSKFLPQCQDTGKVTFVAQYNASYLLALTYHHQQHPSKIHVHDPQYLVQYVMTQAYTSVTLDFSYFPHLIHC